MGLSVMALGGRWLQIELDELVADCRGRQHAQVGKKQSDERWRCVVDDRMLLGEILGRFQRVRFVLGGKNQKGNELLLTLYVRACRIASGSVCVYKYHSRVST